MQAYGTTQDTSTKERYTLADDYVTTSHDMTIMSGKGLNITGFGGGKTGKKGSSKASGIED